MTNRHDVDLCIIGAGSGGLSVAAGAAQMGASVVLIEKAEMGGDCLNFGCVPSKSLIAAAAAADSVRRADRFGVRAGGPTVDYRRVHDHVHAVIAAIAPHDSQARFEGLGVTVIRAAARFVAPRRVEAGDHQVAARRFVVATGSAPAVPPIPGLDSVPFHTNETIFATTVLPAHLIVIGGGPIGMELAQAYRRLGSRVTVVEAFAALGKDDPELARVVSDAVVRDGVALYQQTRLLRVERVAGGVAAVVADGSGARRIEGSDLLVAAGRRPVTDGLGLAEAGIAFTGKGITVDAALRTTNRRVYAIGDVAGGLQFTHMAGHHAGVVLRNALFRLPAKVERRAIPWVTYTAPELAQVGLTEAAARERYGTIRVLRAAFSDNDRARAELSAEGLVKVVTTGRGRVLGAGIVGPHAGELIQLWVLAVAQGLGIGAIAGMIAPYPTLGEASKRAAGAFYTPTLFGPRSRWLVRALRLLG